MQLNILGSSSAGNCYIIQSDSEALVIEAGVKVSAIKKALGYNISKVSGVITTHAHGDHSSKIKDCADAGMNVYAISDVMKSRGILTHRRAYIIKPMQGFKVGNFQIYPFPVEHDIPCVGFHINHPDIGNLLFLTDTFTCDYSFPNLNHILIEANYSDIVLQTNILKGEVSRGVRKRLMYSHMEFETTKNYLTATDLTNVSNIVLIHLSSQNSDEKLFVEQIQQLTGKAVYAADSDMVLQLNQNTPY